MVAAIQAQAQARPVAPVNVMPNPLNVGVPPQQGRPNNGNQYGNGNNNWNNGQGNGNANWNNGNGQGIGNLNQNRNQGNYQQNRGNYQPQQGSRTEWKFGQIDGWVTQGVQLCQNCGFGNHDAQNCMFANMPLNRNPNLFATQEWERLRTQGGWRQAVANGYDLVAAWRQFKQQNGGNQGGGQGGTYNGGGRGGFRGRGRGNGRGGYGNRNWRANNNGGGGGQNNGGGGANGAGQGQQNEQAPQQEMNQGNEQDQ
ncbi:heterogeneous nuclear ribonucleoprotein A1-like [Paramacrobiotus metropolitanus]|uniref:heterogeneous nuclear ribonucleoprotein A1-like n=1 Tax=Paramacrobiotus metropolitanus TaxID=2943436 RepID=UPI0024465BEA|nr:heterogeneous nuclear ribonucleoprotein A1-like [Paramacrobiotus metropolitanus]